MNITQNGSDTRGVPSKGTKQRARTCIVSDLLIEEAVGSHAEEAIAERKQLLGTCLDMQN